MVLSQPLFQTLVAAIKERSPHDFAIQSVTPVSGGDINRAYRIQTGSANYFVKTNDVATANAMFLAESNGLALLRRTPGVKAPDTFMVGNAHGEAFLLMEWLDQTESGRNQDTAQEALSRMVAHLHRQQSDTYGLDHDNFIGRLRDFPRIVGPGFAVEHQRRVIVKGTGTRTEPQPNCARRDKRKAEGQNRIFVIFGARKFRCFAFGQPVVDLVEIK